MSDAAVDAAIRTALTFWFGIPRGACAVLCALYRANGRPLSVADLAAAAMATPKSIVNYHVHCLRQSLAEEAIDYAPDAGYSLTIAGLAECRHALRRIGEDLRRELREQGVESLALQPGASADEQRGVLAHG
ncbi:MAG TPA: hypothetical protein VKT30_10260 [Caulobacteraceae bacterium]|nr:hypothetical protein [Caulobacteraceae bacterium]